MRTRMTILILLLAAAPALAETHVSIGVHLGGGHGYGYYPAPPPPPVYVYQSPCPGPGYWWVPGSYYRVGPRYSWRTGYWAAPHSHGWHSGPAYRVYDNDSRGGKHHGRGNSHGYKRGR